MDATYWPLLPADECVKASTGRRTSASDDGEVEVVKRRVLTRVACNPCRTKKAACDGVRPTCSLCAKRGRQCNYLSKYEQETPLMVLKRQNDDLEKDASGLADLLACFKYSSANVSLDILMRLRKGDDPLDIIAGLKDAPPDGEIETIFRARDQELKFTELDEDMFPRMEIEYTDELENDMPLPESWLEGERDSLARAESSSQDCSWDASSSSPGSSPDSSQNSSQSSPPDQSSNGSPPYETENYRERPPSRTRSTSNSCLFTSSC